MRAIAYNKITGDITSMMNTQVSDLSKLQTYSTGFMFINDDIDMETSYVKDGEILSRPKKPFAWYRWNGNEWFNPKTPEQAWSDIRTDRDDLLLKSDWTQLPDVPLATKEAWAVYRQALRDITNQPDPFNITWPIPPQ